MSLSDVSSHLTSLMAKEDLFLSYLTSNTSWLTRLLVVDMWMIFCNVILYCENEEKNWSTQKLDMTYIITTLKVVIEMDSAVFVEVRKAWPPVFPRSPWCIAPHTENNYILVFIVKVNISHLPRIRLLMSSDSIMLQIKQEKRKDLDSVL